MLTIFNVISKDGFIADTEGREDFIPEAIWEYDIELYQRYDTLIMGKHTYAAIQAYDDAAKKLLEDLPIRKIVLSHDQDLKLKNGYEACISLEAALLKGKQCLLSSGPSTNDRAMKQKLVDTVIQYELSEQIGNGIRPFTFDVTNMMQVVSHVKMPYGILSEYIVKK